MGALTNYHTHTVFCDGKAEPEEFIKAAVDRGFIALGFSAHAPVRQQESWTMAAETIPDYMNAIDNLRSKYADTIEIYNGMEVDYLPGELGPSSPFITDLGLDYILGAVHCIRLDKTDELLTVDGPAEDFRRILQEQFDGDRKAAVEHYFSLMQELITRHQPDMIAHFDVVKVRNRGEEHYKESDKWYRNAVLSALDAAAKTGVIIEINTGGLSRGKTDTFYPAPWILREAFIRDIPITVNSDVHVPEKIDALCPEAAEAARKAGYTTKRVLLGGGWQDIPL